MSDIGVSVTAKPITARPDNFMGETTHRLQMGAVTIHINAEIAAQWLPVIQEIAEGTE